MVNMSIPILGWIILYATYSVLYVIYKFKLNNMARSSRTFFDYTSKQDWFTFMLVTQLFISIKYGVR